MLREQVAERQPPAAVGVAAADPLPQCLLELLWAIQGDEQLVLGQLPGVLLTTGGDALLEILQQARAEGRVGIFACRHVERRDEVTVLKDLIELRLLLFLGSRFFRLWRLRTKELQACLGDLRQVPVRERVEIQFFDGQPRYERDAGCIRVRNSPGDLASQMVGVLLLGEAETVSLLLLKLGALELLRVRDFGHERVEAPMDHSVRELVEAVDLREQAVLGVLHIGELVEEREGLVFVVQRPGRAEQGLEQLTGVRRPIMIGRLLPTQA